VEHRAFTTSRHLQRSMAVVLASPQDILVFRSSMSWVLRQVFVGLPLRLVPWWFQSRACLAILGCCLRGVCPIQLHFFCTMESVIGICPGLSHISRLEILSGHHIRKICLKQVLMKTYRRLVLLHVSVSYRRTVFTLLLKSLSFVLMYMLWFFHTGPNVAKAWRAFPILAMMSSYVPSVLLTMLHRYVQVSTSSIACPPMSILCVFPGFILRHFVLSTLISSTVVLAISWSRVLNNAPIINNNKTNITEVSV